MTPDNDPGRSKFMLDMLEQAMQMVHEALSAGRNNDATGLYRGNGNDSLATAGALLSAWSAFTDQLGEVNVEMDDFTSLAASFIRIAFNRMRRARRQEQRMDGQVERGHAPDGEGGFMPFDPADPKQREGILKNVNLEVADVLSACSSRDRLVIELKLDGHTYEEIANRVQLAMPEARGTSIAGVCRIMERFHDEMQRRLGSF